MRRVAAVSAAVLLAAAGLRGDQQTSQQTRPTLFVQENPPQSSDLFRCGNDQTLPNPIPERWSTVVLAGDARTYTPCVSPGRLLHPPEHREKREEALIARAMQSSDPEIRWRAVQASMRIRSGGGAGLGHFITSSGAAVIRPACNGIVQIFGTGTYPKRYQPDPAFNLLLDPSPGIQIEGAYALGEKLLDPGPDPDLLVAAVRELQSCMAKPVPEALKGAILEDLGVATYADRDSELRGKVEQFIVLNSQGGPEVVLGAARGLNALIRQHPENVLDERTRPRLRALAVYGQNVTQAQTTNVGAIVRRLAVQSLMMLGDTDPAFLDQASVDGDWQVRRLIAGRLNLADPQQAGIAQRFAADQAFQVRYELLASLSHHATTSHECAPLARFMADPEEAVAMRAFDLLRADCTDLDDIIGKVSEKSEGLDRRRDTSSWHLPLRAFVALARLKPEDTKPRIAVVARNDAWQVRAVMAGVAAVLGDEATLLALAGDAHPNVRTAALAELVGLKHDARISVAIDALRTSMDYQLLLTAALALKGAPEAARPEATEALLGAMTRLTDEAADTSRDTRVAIVDRLAETLPLDRSTFMQNFMADFDDEVAAAARDGLIAMIGGDPMFPVDRYARYPYQPVENAIKAPPTSAVVVLEDGVVTLRLLPDVAPVTVARFVEMALAKAYDERVFYRASPTAIAQAGGPDEHEYSSMTKRFLRTEAGPQARHVRGAVGMFNHGLDTGDGQIFFDLVDAPEFDRRYTVFAYVVGGMEFVDRLREGSKILSIQIK